MAYKLALKKLLSQGYSPYENYKVTEAKIEKLQNETNNDDICLVVDDNQYTVREALTFALEQKLHYLSRRGKINIRGNYKRFLT